MTDRLREALGKIYNLAGWQADDEADETDTNPEDMAAHINGLIRQVVTSALAEPDVCTWIDSTEKLPDFNHVVLAWLEGEENHSGMAWRRFGYAFMVRHDAEEVVKNGWATSFYRSALTKLGADYADVTYWMPLPEPPGCGREIEVKE